MPSSCLRELGNYPRPQFPHVHGGQWHCLPPWAAGGSQVTPGGALGGSCARCLPASSVGLQSEAFQLWSKQQSLGTWMKPPLLCLALVAALGDMLMDPLGLFWKVLPVPGKHTSNSKAD